MVEVVAIIGNFSAMEPKASNAITRRGREANIYRYPRDIHKDSDIICDKISASDAKSNNEKLCIAIKKNLIKENILELLKYKNDLEQFKRKSKI